MLFKGIVKKSNTRDGKRGAALIIALLVITVVTGITFYTGRLTVREIILMSRLENSINAYYAAEAGIEQGLLMFKFDHDVETSQNASENDVRPVKISMDENRSYELNIWHKMNLNQAEQATLLKDDAVEYNIENMSSLVVTCLSGCDNALYDAANPYKYSLEYWTLKNNAVDQKDLIYPGSAKSKTVPIVGSTSIRLRSWGNDKTYRLTAANQKIDSRYTTIESVGTFGDTKRKIKVQLDRNSGRIISIFDFVLFGGTEIKIEP